MESKAEIATRDAAINAAANEIRAAYEGDTRRMVREMAGRLFYSFGEHPTAHRVLSLLRKGSMTTISDEMRGFWAEIRSKSMVRLTRPELPDAVLSAFGDAALGAWRVACDQAEAAYEVRDAKARHDLAISLDEAQQAVALAREAASQALADSNAAREETGRVTEDRRQAEARAAQLQAELAGAQTALASIQGQLTEARADAARDRTAYERQQEILQGQIAAMHKERDRDAEILDGLRKKSLTDIEEARAETRRVREEARAAQAEIERERDRADARAENLGRELASSRDALSQARQHSEAAMAREVASKDERQRLQGELTAARSRLDELLVDSGACREAQERATALARQLETAARIGRETTLDNARVFVIPLLAEGGLAEALATSG